MKFGIVNLYPYRPHMQDTVYISSKLEELGHECFYLKCDGQIPTCYYNLFKGEIKSKTQCLKCNIGGISSYKNNNITKIDKRYSANLSKSEIDYMIDSTIYSLGRIENKFEATNILKNEEKYKLQETVKIVYQNTINWIKNNNIEAAIVFNGRLDITRATIHALNKMNIPFISTENHLNGIMINYGDDCLSLNSIDNINSNYKDVNLNLHQSKVAGRIIGELFMKKQNLWRTHNMDSVESEWPINHSEKSLKILIAPSSKYEFLGNDDWNVEWTDDYTVGYEAVIKSLGVNYNQCVLRCHPYWSEKLGNLGTGNKSENHYTNWAKEKGVYIISSEDKTDTLSLIEEADIVLVNGGTVGIEAAILGKKVITIGKSRYNKAGFTTNVFSKADCNNLNDRLNTMNKDLIQRRTIRYIYNYHRRYEQLYDVIQRENPLKNNYFECDEIDKYILDIFKNKSIEAYDLEETNNEIFEKNVQALINSRQWSELIKNCVDYDKPTSKKEYYVKKRGIYSIVDKLREKMPAGHY